MLWAVAPRAHLGDEVLLVEAADGVLLERETVARRQPPAVGLPLRGHPIASLLQERPLGGAVGIGCRNGLKAEVLLVLEDRGFSGRDRQRIGCVVSSGVEARG